MTLRLENVEFVVQLVKCVYVLKYKFMCSILLSVSLVYILKMTENEEKLRCCHICYKEINRHLQHGTAIKICYVG